MRVVRWRNGASRDHDFIWPEEALGLSHHLAYCFLFLFLKCSRLKQKGKKQSFRAPTPARTVWPGISLTITAPSQAGSQHHQNKRVPPAHSATCLCTLADMRGPRGASILSYQERKGTKALPCEGHCKLSSPVGLVGQSFCWQQPDAVQ